MAISLYTPTRPVRTSWTTFFIRAFAAIGVILILERTFAYILWSSRPDTERGFTALSHLGLKFPFEASHHIDPAKGSTRKSIIVASVAKENAKWVNKNFQDWEINTYVADARDATYTVFKNQGREATVYLTYIINHYYNLPDYMVFMHARRYQWHNDDPLYDGIIPVKNLQLDNVDKEGYVSLRCAHDPGCPKGVNLTRADPDGMFFYHNAYRETFKDFFPETQVPDTVGAPCCSTFAVSKAAVLSRRVEQYEQYRQWIWTSNIGGGKSGRVFEYMWHIIFGKPANWCPPADECYCKTFGLCDLKCPNAPRSCEGRYWRPPFTSGLPGKWPKIGAGTEGYPPSLDWWREYYPSDEYDEDFHLRPNVTRVGDHTKHATASSHSRKTSASSGSSSPFKKQPSSTASSASRDTTADTLSSSSSTSSTSSEVTSTVPNSDIPTIENEPPPLNQPGSDLPSAGDEDPPIPNIVGAPPS